MKRIKFYFDHEKEERWINEMSTQGWHLKKFIGCLFTFERGEPDKYIYRNEFIGFSMKKQKEYIEFIEESGIEVVSVFAGWAYCRQQSENGMFQLYTDNASKIKYINRLLTIFSTFFILNILLGIANLTTYALHVEEFLGGVHTGIAATLLIPIYINVKRRQKLKQQQLFHE